MNRSDRVPTQCVTNVDFCPLGITACTRAPSPERPLEPALDRGNGSGALYEPLPPPRAGLLSHYRHQGPVLIRRFSRASPSPVLKNSCNSLCYAHPRPISKLALALHCRARFGASGTLTTMAAGWPNPIGLYLLAKSDGKITKVAAGSGTVLAPFSVRVPGVPRSSLRLTALPVQRLFYGLLTLASEIVLICFTCSAINGGTVIFKGS